MRPFPERKSYPKYTIQFEHFTHFLPHHCYSHIQHIVTPVSEDISQTACLFLSAHTKSMLHFVQIEQCAHTDRFCTDPQAVSYHPHKNRKYWITRYIFLKHPGQFQCPNRVLVAKTKPHQQPEWGFLPNLFATRFLSYHIQTKMEMG